MEIGISCPRTSIRPWKLESYVQETLIGQGKRNFMSKNVYSAMKIVILCPRTSIRPRKSKSYVQERLFELCPYNCVKEGHTQPPVLQCSLRK